ncbi:hypothetical protein AB1Y20_006567 [Prymnesium parvum]|uniref:Pyruvate kinase n=1 Tax=Prymnesium parvum TaxID=97485 RepID=A0AB34IXT3_PRYPA
MFLRADFETKARAAAKPRVRMQSASQDALCMLDHCSKLDIYSPPAAMRSTGIICTIGPKTKAVEKLTMLREAGMNIVRMNFSHGSYEYHGEVIKAARQSYADSPLGGRLLAIALDTKGPEIRTGSLKEGLGSTVPLEKGAKVTITTDAAKKDECSAELIYMDYANLPKVMSVGQSIMVDDGLIELQVTEIDVAAGQMQCVVVNSGNLGGKKGCNLPEVNVDLPALSEKDIEDLKFAVKNDVDMIFASFIRKGSDVRDVRACLVAADPVIGKRIRIISKIENHEGMRNFDEILKETDGVMVARGDLGIEIPTSKVFLAQKMMIAKCNIAGKPVICATQMLESMTFNPRPTRAEASDVANAVLDGADCVMLSGETAKGDYPKEAVTVMADVCKEAESALFYKAIATDIDISVPPPLTPSEAVANACVNAATSHEARLIITMSTTGTSARLISKYRPRCPILVLCRDSHVGAACNLHRGCIPFLYPHDKPADGNDIDQRIQFALQVAMENGLCSTGDTVALAFGMQSGVLSLTDFHMTIVGEDIGPLTPNSRTINTVPRELVDMLAKEIKVIKKPESLARTSHAGMQKLSQDARCMLDHCSKLDIYSPPAAMRSTGIICTIGPKTKAVEKLTMLREAGMNIVRMNFSHGSYEYHGEVIKAARQSYADSPLSGRLLAIALDTKGPEIRTGSLKEGLGSTVPLEKGAKVTITTDAAKKDECSAELIYMDYANLPKVMSVGQSIMVDDGLIELQVTEIDVAAGQMQCVVVNSGNLGGKKGCNLPEVNVDLPALSEKDIADLKFAVKNDVDMIFASFIRKGSDVRDVRACLVAADPVIGKRIRIISKIENHEGMRNFDEILKETDGVMVARGDLGIEIPTSKVFLAQKMMIAKCNIAGKPVICATQMLESMTFNPRPTRAEASDVANAVLDGADCVMLSGETAKGDYPKEAVTVMADVCREAEAAIFYQNLVRDMEAVLKLPLEPNDAVAKALVEAATCSEARLIITLTRTGNSARLISKHRPRCPIMVLASDPHVGAACNLHHGCIPFRCPPELATSKTSEEERFLVALKIAKSNGLVSSGDPVVLGYGVKSGKTSLSNFRVVVLA